MATCVSMHFHSYLINICKAKSKRRMGSWGWQLMQLSPSRKNHETKQFRSKNGLIITLFTLVNFACQTWKVLHESGKCQSVCDTVGNYFELTEKNTSGILLWKLSKEVQHFVHVTTKPSISIWKLQLPFTLCQHFMMNEANATAQNYLENNLVP